jgi:hypothetical protein
MFRNKGHAQILSPQWKLHFIPVPYTGNVYHSPILLLHLGHLSKEMRKQKYDFYQKEDTERCQKDYSHLINENVQKETVDHISVEQLSKAISIFYKQNTP